MRATPIAAKACAPPTARFEPIRCRTGLASSRPRIAPAEQPRIRNPVCPVEMPRLSRIAGTRASQEASAKPLAANTANTAFRQRTSAARSASTEGLTRGSLAPRSLDRSRRPRRPGGPMPLQIPADEFERLVVDELDQLPDDMVDGLENVVFVVEDRPEDGSLDVLGTYDGVALTQRDRYGFGEMPDRIIVFREPLLAICEDEEELRDEIHVTLVHEIAHYYGIDDDRLHDLGWA